MRNRVFLILTMGGVLFTTCGEVGAQMTENAYKAHRVPTSYVRDAPSDVFATTVDFARKYGYPVETHTVETEDGYLLTLHRIPGSPRRVSRTSREPVLLMHGLLAASDGWLIMGPDHSLGFLLADRGYDVWIGNFRGNFYSRRHVSLSPADYAFWNFSWHEMAVYDLPALIDHVLKVTGRGQLFYIGHSMGTTTFFAMASIRPEYNDKVRLMVAFAPVTYLALRGVGAGILRNHFSEIFKALNRSGIYEILPRTNFQQRLFSGACRKGQPTLGICTFLLQNAFGSDLHTLNASLLPVAFSHFFAGSSINSLAHFLEIFVADRFQTFDPSLTPGKVMPAYDLSRVTAPICLVYAPDDTLVNPEGVARLKKQLRNVVKTVRIPDDRATHLDFVLSFEAKDKIFNEVFAIMKRYS